MAKDKKGFILYADQKELFDQLPNEKAGELIKFIFAYVNDENPETKDLLLNLAFTPIKQQLKRDLVKYEGKIDKKSISGREGNLKRWYLDVYNDYKNGKTTLEEAENIAKHRKASHTDKVRSHPVANIAVNDTVNDTVNVTVNDKVKENNIKDIDFLYSLYPTKCNTRNSSTGKTEKNKEQIKKLLKTNSQEKLSNIIKRYVKENEKAYMKNFGTFLNNLPDYDSKEIDPNQLDDKYIYFQWNNDPTAVVRRTPKEGSDQMFKNQKKGGYTPVIFTSIKNKNKTWK